MNIEKVLEKIKDDSLKEAKSEFSKLLADVKQNMSGSIARSAHEIETALIHRAKGELSKDDVKTLLDKLKIIEKIEENTSKIEALSRSEKMINRIIALSIDRLLDAIVPVKAG